MNPIVFGLSWSKVKLIEPCTFKQFLIDNARTAEPRSFKHYKMVRYDAKMTPIALGAHRVKS